MKYVIEVSTPRVIISAPKGKVGKTLTTILLAYKLTRLGLRVQLFKIGPDFIDPTYHRYVTGRCSRNLDVYMQGIERVLTRLALYTQDIDIALIEGVFGLYDSPDGISEFGSTAYVAKLTKTPVVLVLDCERTNRSVIPIIRGLREFDPKVKIRGIILTNVSGIRHVRKLTKLLETYLPDVEIIGMIPRDAKIEQLFKYRHLGLVPIPEKREREEVINILDHLSQYVNIDSLLKVAREADPVRLFVDYREPTLPENVQIKIGIVYDEAFTFYYPETIEYCMKLSSNVYFLSAIRDQEVPPDVDILIVGGGFPEEYAEKLSKNRSFRAAIRKFAEKGGFIYAECGGLMYLVSKVVTFQNEEYDMCDVIEGITYMLRRPVGHGYVLAEIVHPCPMGDVGTYIRGHEFHHSKLILQDKEAKLCLRLHRGFGVDGRRDGILKGNVYAQYMHIHPDGYNFVKKLIDKYLEYQFEHR